jgi:polar amino acid transport system ATP-binding protein
MTMSDIRGSQRAGIEPIIDARGVTKRFGTHQVLSDVNLQIYPSEVVCIVGPSGSGKSTLLRCMNFLEDYSEGEIYVAGQLLGYRIDRSGQRVRDTEANIARVRKPLGMVFQQFNLWPHMTVAGNIMEALIYVQKRSATEARAIAERVLDQVGLRDKIDEYPARLSGGQQQRAAIARSLALAPAMMLLDEPTSSLDPELVGEVLTVMKTMARDGMTMAVVTHEMGFAAQMAHRVVFLDQGRIIAEGPPRAIFHEPEHTRLGQFLRSWKERNAFWETQPD